jgi:hypothetical protein
MKELAPVSHCISQKGAYVQTQSREDWEELIGKFILVCGNIELRLIQIHWNLCIIDEVEINDFKEFGLGQKAIELRKTVKKRRLEQQIKKKIIRTLGATIEFSKYRNLVAHNPLSMDYYDDAKGRLLPPAIIYSLKNYEEHISYDELALKLDEAKAIEAELFSLVCEAGMVTINRSDDEQVG